MLMISLLIPLGFRKVWSKYCNILFHSGTVVLIHTCPWHMKVPSKANIWRFGAAHVPGLLWVLVQTLSDRLCCVYNLTIEYTLYRFLPYPTHWLFFGKFCKLNPNELHYNNMPNEILLLETGGQSILIWFHHKYVPPCYFQLATFCYLGDVVISLLT